MDDWKDKLGKKYNIEPAEKKKENFPLRQSELNNLFCPVDTGQLISSNNFYEKIDNYSLKLNKIPKWEGDKFKVYKKGDRNNPAIEIKPNFNSKQVKNISEKLFESVKLLLSSNNYIKFDFTTNWRLIVGLGHPSVYETSITLHHIYGIPYIPSSSLKGIVRSWIISEKFSNDEQLALKDKEHFCKVFGYQTNTGKIIFFDAFPIDNINIVQDVMNVHYPKYYNGNEAPTDYQNPNPVFFSTIKDTSFQFIIGSKKEKLESFIIGNKTITEWLKDSLENHGIGAKTAVGYGYMKK